MPTNTPPRGEGNSRAKSLTVSRPELLANGSDGQFRALLHGVLAFAARLQAVRDGFAALLGLTGIQYTILISIRHLQTEGEVTVGAVAGHLHLSGAFVTTETGKLLRAGLITKVQDITDRRRVCLRVAPKGRDLLSDLAPVQVQVNDVMFEFLGAEQLKALGLAIDRIVTCGDRAISLLDYLSKDFILPSQVHRPAALDPKTRQRGKR
jgi:MarR family transcriptional regulator, organic hydroperoxide resistance regulator